MKNDATILSESDKTIFKNEINKYLSNNLSDYLINSLANMLTIDYTNRLKKEPELNSYLKNCIFKLKSSLNHRIITEEDFSTTMSLFAIAIGNKKTTNEELINEQDKNQDVILDGLISANFSDLSPEDQKSIKQVLKSMLMGSNPKEILNFINSDPKLFYSVVISAQREKKNQKEIAEFVAININKIITETKAINKKITTTKSLFSKVALAAGLVAVASLTGLVGGALLPILLAPAAAISIKFAPDIGSKLSSTLSRNNNYIQKKQDKINEIVSAISTPVLEQGLLQEKYLSQKKIQTLKPEITIKPEFKTNVKNLEHIKNVAKKNTRQR